MPKNWTKEKTIYKGYPVNQDVDPNKLKIPFELGSAAVTPEPSNQEAITFAASFTMKFLDLLAALQKIGPMDTRLVSIEQSAKALGISRDGVRRLISRGELASVKISRRVMVKIEDIERLVEFGTSARSIEPAGEPAEKHY
jgi:excisionase family DNA binding protein